MSLVSPPRWLDRILEWYCSEELLEEIHGDLHEAYEHRVAKSGKIKANWWYFLDVLQFFRPYSFEKYSGSKQYLPMFSNYIKIASRNLIKRKGYTALNLLGLSIGLSAVMLVGIYLQHEHSYDQIHPQSENIHRLVNNYRDQTYNCMFFSDYYQSDQNTQLLLLNHLKAYEEIEVACHFVPTHSPIGSNAQYYVQAGGKKLVLDKFMHTNTGVEFQSVFPQDYLLGTMQTSYSDFGIVTLTETTAEKLFGQDWAEQEILNSSLRI